METKEEAKKEYHVIYYYWALEADPKPKSYYFEGNRCEMQWYKIASCLQIHLHLDLNKVKKHKPTKQSDLGKLIAFREGKVDPPGKMDQAIHPLEIIDEGETLILKKLPSWKLFAWCATLPEKPDTDKAKMYPKNATDEEKMKLLLKQVVSWRSSETNIEGGMMPPKNYLCRLCHSSEHTQFDCPNRRICGVPKTNYAPVVIK